MTPDIALQAHWHVLRRRLLAAIAATSVLPAALAQEKPDDGKRLEGLWGGELTHKGARTDIYLALAPGSDGTLRARVSLPVLNMYEVPLGRATLSGSTLRFASMAFEYDAGTDRLSGTLPADIAPVYTLATVLTRRSKMEKR